MSILSSARVYQARTVSETDAEVRGGPVNGARAPRGHALTESMLPLTRTPFVSAAQRCTYEECRHYDGMLSADERRHAETLRLTGDRERFLTGRILLRLALSRAVAQRVAPAMWRFVVDDAGKPRVDQGLPELHFNLSHAAGVVVVAIDPAQPIGVDVECLDADSAAHVPAEALSPLEAARISRCAPELRGREIVKLWTLKEAVAKRNGVGVRDELASFEISCDPHRSHQGFIVRGLFLETRTVAISGADYQISLAAHPHPAPQPAVWFFLSVADMNAGPVRAEHAQMERLMKSLGL